MREKGAPPLRRRAPSTGTHLVAADRGGRLVPLLQADRHDVGGCDGQHHPAPGWAVGKWATGCRGGGVAGQGRAWPAPAVEVGVDALQNGADGQVLPGAGGAWA